MSPPNLKAVLAFALVALLLGALGFFVHQKSDPLVIGGIATALGAGIPMVFRFFAGTGKDGGSGSGGAAAAVLVAGSILLGTTDCGGVQDKALTPEDVFRDEQLACVATYDTRESILDCRRRVHEAWGIAETVTKDGGAK